MTVQSAQIITSTNPLNTAKDLSGVPIWGRSAPKKSTDQMRQGHYIAAGDELTVTIPSGCNSVIITPDSAGIFYRLGDEAITLPTSGNPVYGVITEASVIAPLTPGDTLRIKVTNSTYIGLDFRVSTQS